MYSEVHLFPKTSKGTIIHKLFLNKCLKYIRNVKMLYKTKEKTQYKPKSRIHIQYMHHSFL